MTESDIIRRLLPWRRTRRPAFEFITLTARQWHFGRREDRRDF